MKRIALALVVAIGSTVAFAEDITAKIKQEAEKCGKSLLSADYDGVVLYTHERVLARLGGKDAMIATLKRSTEAMRSQGVSITEVVIGTPEQPKKIGAWLVTLVPQHIRMTVPKGEMQQDSHLLGISEDDGKKWVFVDAGVLAKSNLGQVFPELDGKIDVPERKPPVFSPK